MEKQFVTSTRTVRHILKRDLRFVLRIFAVLLEIGVDGGDEPAACGLVRRAAVLEPRGVVIVFQTAQIAREAQRRRDLYLIFRLVRPSRPRRSVSQYCGMVKALPSVSSVM